LGLLSELTALDPDLVKFSNGEDSSIVSVTVSTGPAPEARH
jgi:hypothetical protein